VLALYSLSYFTFYMSELYTSTSVQTEKTVYLRGQAGKIFIALYDYSERIYLYNWYMQNYA